MIGLCRVVRGLIGFLMLMQLFGLVISLLWLPGYGIGSFLYRVALLVISGGLFFGLRHIINRLYLNKHGVPHPTLAEQRWAL